MDGFRCLCSLLCLGAAWAELRVSVVSPRTAMLGSDTLLECTFKVDTSRVDSQNLAITWRFKGKKLLSVEDALKVFDSRASIDEAKIVEGNASLKLSALMTSHEGEYTCSLIYSPDHMEKVVTLNLQAYPRIIVQEPAVIIGKENPLRCSVVGFYPMEISVRWYRDGQILPGSSMSQTQRHANGTFMVNSTVLIVPTDRDANHTFSCLVHHSSLVGPLQKDVTLLLQEEEKTVSVMVVMLSVLAIVVIMVGLGWLLHRSLACKELQLCEIQGPVTWTIDETVELICVGRYYPKDIKVTWIKLHQGKATEVEALASPTEDDGQPLLSMNRYRAESRKDGGNLTLISTLFITPTLEEDEGAVFKCRFFTSDHKVTEEKEFKGFKLYDKPQAYGNITCIPQDGMNVQCALVLMQFYPEQIQVKWSSGSEMLEDVSSEERKTENADRRTFDVRTECTIPEEAFNDGNFMIRVTWEHASLKAPEYREMSVTDPDFPGRPRLEGITVPPLVHGFEASLQCEVAGYFPKKLLVQWLKVEKTSNGHCPQYVVANEDIPQCNAAYVPVTPSDGIYPPLSQFSESAAPLRPCTKRDSAHKSNESVRPVFQSDGSDGLVPQSNKKNGNPLQLNASDSHLQQSGGLATTSSGIGEPLPKRNESDGHPPQSDGNDERVIQTYIRDDHVPPSEGLVTTSNGTDGYVPPFEDISIPSFEDDVSDLPLPPSDESDDDVLQSIENERTVPQSDGRDGLVYGVSSERVNQMDTSDGIGPQSNASDWLVSQSNGSDGLEPHLNKVDGHKLKFEGPGTISDGFNGSVPQYQGSDGPVRPSDGGFMSNALQSNENGLPVPLSNASASLHQDLSCYKSMCTFLRHEPGKGYSCAACLVFTPDLRRDQGSTFICHVSHPSLKEALEKSTGKLNVLSEPKVSELKLDSSRSEGVRLLRLIVHGFYPAKVTVLWTWDPPGKPLALPSALHMTEGVDDAYTAHSTCQLSKTDRKRIGEKHTVTVTVEHEALREPLKAAIRLEDKGRQFKIVGMNFEWAPKSHKLQSSTAAVHLMAQLACFERL